MPFLTPQRKYLLKLKKYLPRFLQPKQQVQRRKKINKDAPKPTAFLVAYCGKNYYGVNFNWDVPTIEMTLMSQLHNLGLIPPIKNDIREKVNLQRVSRTDKGVSAASNIIQLKEDILQRLNESLPAEIQVLDMQRCPRDFKDHKDCVSRIYSYTLPTLAFSPIEETVTHDYRVSLDIIERVNEVLEKFQGHHSFHNFTMYKVTLAKDPGRLIYDFECGMPFVQNGMEFCEIRIKGSSFMMHQIRKMIGLTIAIVRGYCDDDVINLCWEEAKVDIPKAPGLGLVLEKLYFFPQSDLFFGKTSTKERKTENLKKMLEFRAQHILPEIIRTEVEQNSMMNWLDLLPFYKYQAVNLDGSDNWRIRSLIKVKNHIEDESDVISDSEIVSAHIEGDDDDVTIGNKQLTKCEDDLRTKRKNHDEDNIENLEEETYKPKREKVKQSMG